MARTRKSIQPLNLYKYDVLIEDQGTRSDYFKISQFDGYFYGGRNAFLVAGAGSLKPNSKILVEILNVDGTTVYSAPVTQFVEGNSRLIQVEIYNDTPIGAGKIVILGSTDTYLDGSPVPPEWKDKYNVRWITDVIISPLIENKTPIRFATTPSVVVEEKFYRIPSSSIFTEKVLVPISVQLTPKYYSVFQNGYQLKISGSQDSQFLSEYQDGIITGSVAVKDGETASLSLPITRIFNSTLAESQGSLIYTNTNKLITEGFISGGGGFYTSSLSPLGTVILTSSLNLQYSKLETFNTGSAVSYANLRVVDAKTLSGEIHKVRVSYKNATDPGEYVTLSDVNVAVQELLAVDSASKIVETGKFNTILANDYWYTATMSLQKNENTPTIPLYYKSSSLISNSIPLTQSNADLLDSINVTPTIVNNAYINDVSYFIGTRTGNSVQVFPRSEYTLAFDAVVSKKSGSVELNQADYSLEVYLVAHENSTTKLLETNLRGQLLGTLTPSSTFTKQNFEGTEFNFTPKIIDSGDFGLRFIAYGGNWNIANISLKPAEEPFFSPDEIDILVPNVNYTDKILSFKLQYLDVNNNSVATSTLSIPTYFTGSEELVITTVTNSVTSSYAETASFVTHQNPGDNRVITSLGSGSLTGESNLRFDGSTLSVTGSMVVSGSSTLRNIGPAQFTGSVNISGSATVTGNLTVSGLLSANSQSITYVSSSQLNVGTNIITVNVQNPIPRFGGIAVIDSGSSPQRSGSLLFDSQNDQWIFVHQNQTNPTSSVLLMGPQTYNNIGNETALTNNYLLKSVNAEHVGDSQVYDNGTNVGIGTASPTEKLEVSGSLKGIGVETSLYNFKNIYGRLSDSLLHVAGGSGLNGLLYLNYNGGTVSIGQSTAAVFSVNAGNGLYVTTGNNVGIGTTSPSGPLQVGPSSGTPMGWVYFNNNVGPSNSTPAAITSLAMGWNPSNGGGEAIIAYGSGSSGGAGGGSARRLSLAEWNGTTLTEVLTLQNAKVGIGTTSPANKLQIGSVGSSGYGGNDLAIGNGTQVMAFYQYSGGPSAWFTNTNFSLMPSGVGSTGNVGIGTTSPTQKLDVNGSIASRGVEIITSDGTANYLKTGAALYLQYGSTNLGILTADGKLGIGTLSPTSLLHLSSSTAQITIDSSNDAASWTSGIILKTKFYRGSGIRYDSKDGNEKWYAGVPYASSYLGYQIGYDGSSAGTPEYLASASLYINSSRNVGIGTTSPGSKLQVAGDIRFGTNGTYTDLRMYTDTALSGYNQTNIITPTTIPGGGTALTALYLKNAVSVGTNRMDLIVDGNVGIGTTSPTAKLVVNGSNNGGLSLAVNGSDTEGTVAKFARGGSEKNFYVNNTNNQYVNLSTEGDFRFKVGVTTDQPYSTGVSAMVISSSGNVGIGTTSPATPLDVSGGTAGTGGWNRTATLTATYPILLFNSNGTKWAGIGYDYSTAMRIWVNSNNNNVSANTSIVTIANTGRVGIGAETPDSLLHIQSASNAIVRIDSTNAVNNAELKLSYNTSDSHGMTLRYNGNNALAYIDNTYPTASGQVYGDIYFRQNINGTMTSRMMIQAQTGNVGIGTTSPGQKLDIVGRLRFRSDGSVSAGAWHTDSSGTQDVFVGQVGTAYTDDWGVYTNGNWRFQIRRGDGLIYLNGKTAFESADSWLRVNQSAAFSSGVWFGSTPNIGLGGTDSYLSLGSNGGTTNSRIYFRAGTYNGTNVMNFDGTTGNAYYAGNIGIGVSPTSNRLDIQGGHTTTTARLYSIGDGATLNASLDMWASEPGVTYDGSGIGNNVNGHPYYGRRNTSLAQSYIRFFNGNIFFDADSTDALGDTRLFISSSGNVGIGTTSPLYKLHNAGTTYVGDTVSFGAGGNSLISWTTGFSDGTTLLLYGPDAGSIYIRPNAANSGIFLKSNGNVGIGTTNPTAKLCVEGGSANWNETTPGTSNGTIHLDPGVATDNFGNAITFGASDSSNGENAQAGIYVRTDGSYGSKMYFATSNNYGAGATTRMYVAHDGKVGINTTSPSRTLHVVGDILGEGTNGYGLNASSGRYYFFDNFTGNNYIGLGSSNSVALAAGGSVTLTVTSGILDVTGQVRATNEITAYYSDARLKNFHGTIKESLIKITKLNGYYFTENETAKSLGYKNDKMQIGVSAQEVQAVLPEAVVPAPIDDMYLTVKYEKLVPLLIEAIKEQQVLIEQLQERVNMLGETR
jgi:hypothetical protein